MNILKDDEFLEFAAVQESQYLIPASDLREQTKRSFDESDENNGLKLIWPRTHDVFALRGGELTIWAGINGHGKSQVLNQICALTCQVEPWLICSLEMPVRKTMNRLVRQMTGLASPSEEYIDRVIDITLDNVWIYDQTDTVPSERIIAMIHYAAQKLGVRHMIIDSLVKCGMGVDDYNAQKQFVDRLAWAAKRYRIHIHLVHHIRKGKSEEDLPDKFDIKGAGEIGDLADNIVIFHRNKYKERMVEKGETVDEGMPDNVLYVAKQRHGTGWEGRVALYHHPASLQYLSSPKASPFQLGVR